MPDSLDKKALLNELRIDRSAPPPRQIRPLQWLIPIAILAGVGFVFYFVDFTPQAGPPPASSTAAASAPAPVKAPLAMTFDGSILDATGYVVARRQATVSAEVTGQVVEVLIEEGQRVVENELLARLDDAIPRAQLDLVQSQLASARASLKELEVQLRQAKLDLERTRGLAARQLASQSDLDRDTLAVESLDARLARAEREVNVAERSVALQRRALEEMEVRAPFAGVVVAKAAQPGEIVSPMSAGGGFTRTGICTIVDMDSLEVEVDVNEAYINRVVPGQPVRVALNAYPDQPFKAEVIAIIPTADRNKATVRVRIAFLERDEKVLPDMGVKVAFMPVEDEKEGSS
jgi:RND family efflux transporter MFP subunit